MPRLVKNEAIVECHRQFLPKDSDLTAVQNRTDVVPLSLWVSQTDALSALGVDGVWVDSDETLDALTDTLSQLALLAIHFPAFVDGRGFSLGRLARERHQFSGELRAFGYVLQDQAHFLRRCGFDAMDFRQGTDLNSAIESLADFTEHYQASVDQPRPLFRRRT